MIRDLELSILEILFNYSRTSPAQIAVMTGRSEEEVAAVIRSLEAQKIIDVIVFEPVEGEIYDGKVTRIIEIGAFVEFAPGKEGMVHISKLADHRVEKVEDVVKVGDDFKVKFLGTDEKGRLNLAYADYVPRERAPRGDKGPRQGGNKGGSSGNRGHINTDKPRFERPVPYDETPMVKVEVRPNEAPKVEVNGEESKSEGFFSSLFHKKND